MILVESWGIGGSVVDAGRTGRAWLGAARGGAVDLRSFDLANRLLGNLPDSGAIETSGGTRLRFERAAMVVITGAVADLEVAGGPPVGWGAPIVLPAGATLSVGRLHEGARVYVGVRGGVVVKGDQVSIGDDPGTPAGIQPAPRLASRTTIHVWPGPRIDWFVLDAWQTLLGAGYTVGATSRVGTRLSGRALLRTVFDELPPEGLVEGAVQVPPDGQPIVMLAEHPTTGGYPVIAVVDPADLTHVAQAMPGTMLQFLSM